MNEVTVSTREPFVCRFQLRHLRMLLSPLGDHGVLAVNPPQIGMPVTLPSKTIEPLTRPCVREMKRLPGRYSTSLQRT